VYNVVNGVKLRYFKTHEFTDRQTRIAYDKRMDARLLVMLDVLRHMHGRPIRVSNGRGAIGREKGGGFHNWKMHGTVQAIDIVPTSIDTVQDAELFIRLCQKIGFNGIGFYTDWNQGLGYHVDVGDRIAQWGRVDGKYTSIHNALDAIR
jgi:hypothetical protein